MITDCELTTNEIIRTLCPYRDPLIAKKNRLTNLYDIRKNNWTVGHFYIDIDGAGCHHCILRKQGNVMEIIDSFINYRSKEYRFLNYSNFEYLITVLLTETYVNLDERKRSYDILFNPPVPYIDSWNGAVKKIYLEQIY